jgi:hypothetical protein
MITIEGCACPRSEDQATDYVSWAIGSQSPDSSEPQCGPNSCSVITPIDVRAVMDFPSSEDPAGLSSSGTVELNTAFTQWSERFGVLMRAAQPQWPAFGQIWTTKLLNDRRGVSAGDAPARIVVILDSCQQPDEHTASSVVSSPISTDVEYRSDYDLLVDASASPLGYEFMIEVWNEVAMFRDQLGRCLATLSSPIDHRLSLLYRAHLGFEADLVELEGHIGPPIVHHDDPRVAFQGREIKACEYLRHPLAIHEGDHASPTTLALLGGSAVRAARKRLRIDLKQLREQLASCGHAVDVEFLYNLEEKTSQEVSLDLADGMAQVLSVNLPELQVAAVNQEEEVFAQRWAHPHCQALLRKRAQELGISVEAAMARARRELASAAARETRGRAGDQEWLRMLSTLLGTWKA